MAVVMRGWSRTASTAVKLATAERIIGYQFKDVDRLYEALDQTKWSVVSSNGKNSRVRPRNTRLALVGDAQAKLYMAQKWYENQDLSGTDWSNIAFSTLSNTRFGDFGFQLGLDECGIPDRIEGQYDMASTVEALFAAVEMDGASPEQFHKVMARFGLQHKLVDPVQRTWIYYAVKSKLNLPDRFFIGHHFRLQEGIFRTQMKRSTAKAKRIGSPSREKGLWRRIKSSWNGVKRKWLESPAEEPRPTATETILTASKNVATGEANTLSKNSFGSFEDDGRTSGSEQSTSKEDPVGKHKAAEVSPPEVNTPSQAPKPQPQPVLSKGDTPTDDSGITRNDSQDLAKASKDEPGPDSSGAELEVEHLALKALEAERAEETKADLSRNKLKQKLKKLTSEDAKLGGKQRRIELNIRDLRQAGKKRTPEQIQELVDLKALRKRVGDRIRTLKSQLERQSETGATSNVAHVAAEDVGGQKEPM